MLIFTLRGKEYNLRMEDIIKAIKDIEPETVRRYYIEINGREYPIKQVISKALNIPKISFISTDAYYILTKLGFKVYQKGE